MSTKIDDVTDRISGIVLGEDTRDHVASLQQASRSLTRATETIILYTRNIEPVADEANSSDTLSTTEACSLYGLSKDLAQTAKALEKTTHELGEATERNILETLRLHGSGSSSRGVGLVSHFDGEIRAIIREVLHTIKDESLLWTVAEKCYKQAASHSGSLHADHYFCPLEEAQLGWPYDEDFESEEFYEHEENMIDENYARSFQKEVDRRSEEHHRKMQNWVDFWVNVLHNVPAGPTLFYPPATKIYESLHFENLPQYLFRTFDSGSSGTSNESVIASKASKGGPRRHERIDLLTLPENELVESLRMHFDKGCFDANDTDNLISWTSSLLFAIQYAVWRSRWRYEREIKICVVDTTLFAEGQFARAGWLIESFQPIHQMRASVQKSFQYHLGDSEYYNGEYLSQGTVSIANRSCVTSLELLEEAGLFKLYPDFNVDGSTKWTNRVRALRTAWSKERGTSDDEIMLALRIARRCFSELASVDASIFLLTLQNRKLQAHKTPGEQTHFINFEHQLCYVRLNLSRQSSMVRTRAARVGKETNRSPSILECYRSGQVLRQSTQRTDQRLPSA
ncbi:hypothetical protein J4E91_005541 [Alternaria rosae]|nr:hypothetical protein J4E91_005541 [Alternaria rosae]